MSRCTFSRLFLATVLFCAALSLAQAPKISKVDPPNWWANFPHSPMLMITGENLSNARVSVDSKSIRILKTDSSSDGHYLFVYTEQPASVKAGTAHYRVQTSAGIASFDFELKSRAPLAGRAQGVNASDVIYLLMPDRFADGDPTNNDPPNAHGHYNRNEQHAYHGGDLKGVTEHLDYLHDLGVTTLWLTPWWKNDGNSADYHGYHVTDFYGVEDHFGTMKDLQDLVAAAHRQGMKVLMDYVVNHVGPNHPWASHPPTPTWLHGTPEKHLAPAYDFAPLVDPHGTDAKRIPILDGWFADKLPDLNCDDARLTEYLTDNALWWMESASLDGFRLDTFPYSPRSFWSKWHQALFHVYSSTFTVGEVYNPEPAVVSFFQGGRKQYDGIDTGVMAVFDFPIMYAIRDVLLQGGAASKLSETFVQDALYPHPEELVTFIGNHDTTRFVGEKGASVQKLNAAASLLVTFRGIPQIYSGDELAMPGGGDPDNRRDFPGGFAGDSKNAFTAAGRTADQQEAFAHLQKLLRLRREHKALQSGEQTDVQANAGSFVFLRSAGNDRLLMVLNSTSTPQAIHIATAETPLANVRSLSPLDNASSAEIVDGGVNVNVAPATVAIYQVN